jgi:hypothetical protein
MYLQANTISQLKIFAQTFSELNVNNGHEKQTHCLANKTNILLVNQQKKL